MNSVRICFAPFVDSLMDTGFKRSDPSQCLISFRQFFKLREIRVERGAYNHTEIKEVGVITIAFLAAGDPEGPCFNSVHINAIACKVLPSPLHVNKTNRTDCNARGTTYISSARMHPVPSALAPMTQLYINLTPCL